MQKLLTDELSTGNASSPQSNAAVIAAAAGAGLFEKNENVYGFPETKIAKIYSPAGMGAKVEPITSGTGATQPKAFKLTVGNKAFTLNANDASAMK